MMLGRGIDLKQLIGQVSSTELPQRSIKVTKIEVLCSDNIIIGSITSVESIAPVVVTSVRYEKRLTAVQVVEDMRC